MTRIYQIADAAGNTATCEQQITINDVTDPVLSIPNNITLECSDDLSLVATGEATATDNCTDTVNITFSDMITDGDCAGNYTITRTWTATDACDNSTSAEQIITIQDSTAPVLITADFEEVINVECDNIPDIPELMFEDNCSSDIEVTFDESINFLPDTDDYEIIREWVVTDECGNATELMQTVTVSIPTLHPVNGERCIDDGIIDLFDFLQPDVDTSGTWSIVIGNTITINDNLFDPQNGGVVGGIYTFRYEFGGTCPITADVNITLNGDCIVLPCGDEDVTISNTITANGDGINEFFEITGVEDCGFIYDIEIYNRWGAVVYKNSNYQNDWNGQAVSSAVGSANTVPTGTYFYIVTIRNSGMEPFTGPLYVVTGN